MLKTMCFCRLRFDNCGVSGDMRRGNYKDNCFSYFLFFLICTLRNGFVTFVTVAMISEGQKNKTL